MTTAETAFDAVSRAAYAAFVNSPPLISYRISVNEANSVVGVLHVRYDELYDSRSALALRLDEDAKGPNDVDRPFVAAPNLDAVGTFEADVVAYEGRLVFVSYEPLPLNVTPATPPPHVDAYAFANGAYVVRFDPHDATDTTILATPTAPYRAAHKGWLVSRVRFDGASHLPTEVELTDGSRGTFTLTYEVVNGVQLVRRVVLLADAHAYLYGNYLGLRSLYAQADYSDYAFPRPAPTARPDAGRSVPKMQG